MRQHAQASFVLFTHTHSRGLKAGWLEAARASSWRASEGGFVGYNWALHRSVEKLGVLLAEVTKRAHGGVRVLDISGTNAVWHKVALLRFCSDNAGSLRVVRALCLASCSDNDADVQDWVSAGGDAARRSYITTYSKELGDDTIAQILEAVPRVQLHCELYYRSCCDEPGANGSRVRTLLEDPASRVHIHKLWLKEDPCAVASFGFYLPWEALITNQNTLRVLSIDTIDNMLLNDDAMEARLCSAVSSLRLTELRLISNEEVFEDGGVALLDACTGHPTLRLLILCRHEAPNVEARHAMGAALGRLLSHPHTQLETLHLGECWLKADILPLFQALSSRSPLRKLICYDNGVPNHVTEAVLHAVTASALDMLDFGTTRNPNLIEAVAHINARLGAVRRKR